MYWLSYLYGPKNKFMNCPDCRKMVNIEELTRYDRLCRDCYLAQKKINSGS